MQKTPQKNEISDESWDVKKILIALLVVVPILLLIFSYKDILSADLKSKSYTSQRQQKSTSASYTAPSSNVQTETQTPSNLQMEAQKKIEAIRTQIENLNVTEIATTSPQVQKIINDIKALPNYPASQAKGLCLKLCDGL